MWFFPSRNSAHGQTLNHVDDIKTHELQCDSSRVSQKHHHTVQDKALEAQLLNPFEGKTTQELIDDGEKYAKEHGLGHLVGQFKVAALLARVAISDNPRGFESMTISEKDKEALRMELDHKWRQPLRLYFLVGLCSIAAAVQGMDETVANGAQLFYPSQFGIEDKQWLMGLLNSAPYLCCAIFSCWMTDPLNHHFGRRGTILITAVISFVTCFWQGFTSSWPHLFVARFFLGLGIGPKSTTVPVYTAECAPTPIRGALVMMWQMWTAFGIMLGLAADFAMYYVRDRGGIKGLNWRLMLGSAGLPALVIIPLIYYCPESPRWLIAKGEHYKALESLTKLRNSPLQAARDLFYINALLDAEVGLENRAAGRNRLIELFAIPRNRRAAVASFVVMFMQQFCGVNGIAYYSSIILTQPPASFSTLEALRASLGFGAINFIFALPAIWTIDTFGRRNLLLATFPLMSLCMLVTSMAFLMPGGKAQEGVIILSMYMFSVFYSPGEGPVPFTYSAEVHALYIRSIGMSFATAITWFFNFLNAIIFPTILKKFTPQGTFGWFATWNMIGFWLIFFLVPETKELSLEELDSVFSQSTRVHMKYQIRQAVRSVRKYIFRQDIALLPPLYQHARTDGEI